ncbi:MAG: aminoacyl-tRNA hydrolase, partial [Candidatus Levyibacteriota bacterium]
MMKLIVGLGNPGEKYLNTRHNVGFLILDHLLQKLEKAKETYWEENSKFKALTKEIELAGEKIVLLKPTTFMNDSGIAVQRYASFYKIDPQDIYVLHDELDLPLGKIKIRFGGSSAGHNGVNSIIERLGTDKFLRIRLGIGKEARVQSTHDAADYVLGTFAASDKGKIKTMINQAIKNILLIQEHGIDLYMSKYNKQPLA